MMMRVAVNFSGFQKNPSVSESESEELGEVCISNLSPAERRKRLLGGVTGFVIALVVLAVLIASGADRLWRLPLFLLFFGAANGYFQWRDKTWVGLAARGARNLTGKIEKIEDQDALAQVRRQARRVVFKAFLAAISLTLIALVLP